MVPPVRVLRLLLSLGLLLCRVHCIPRAPKYLGCMPGHYGFDCSRTCSCDPENEDCADGPTGDGKCTCQVGAEAICGTGGVSAIATGNHTGTGHGSWTSKLEFVTPRYPHRVDPETSRAARQVESATVARVRPTPFRSPRPMLLGWDPVVAAAIGLRGTPPQPGPELNQVVQVLAGRAVFESHEPFAHCYAGHQFGGFSGQLGDGRAVSLGFVRPAEVPAAPVFEISLKGAGKTPFSRAGDGRAVLRNLVREYLAGVTLPVLGIPACGAAALLGADPKHDGIFRDEWGEGELKLEAPGTLLRACPSFVRYGSLQLAAKRQGPAGLVQLARNVLATIADLEASDDRATRYFDRGDRDGLGAPRTAAVSSSIRAACFAGSVSAGAAGRLVDSCAARAPELAGPAVLECLLVKLTERSAALIAGWQAAGFAHGVMNTDNMLAAGVTIDLNVYGFLSRLDRVFVPSHIDTDGRYAFDNQPKIAEWNLRRVADAMTGTAFLEDYEPDRTQWMAWKTGWLDTIRAERALARFQPRFRLCYTARLRIRLGLQAERTPAVMIPGDELILSGGDAVGGSSCDGASPGLVPCSGGSPAEPNTAADPYGVGLEEKAVFSWLGWLRASGADYHVANRQLGEIDLGLDSSLELAASSLSAASGGDPIADSGLVKALGEIRRELMSGASSSGGLSDVALTVWQGRVRAFAPVYVCRTNVVREIADSVVARTVAMSNGGSGTGGSGSGGTLALAGTSV